VTQNVLPPYPVFVGRDGVALDGAKIYIGNPNTDPVLSPKTVYFDPALSVTAPQPLRTSGGLLYRNGSPTSVYVVGDYSIRITDANNQLIYSAPSAQLRITTEGDVTIPSGTSLIVEIGGSVDMADGSALNLGDGAGAGVDVNVASTTRVSGNWTPDVNGRDLGNSGQRWDLFADTIDVGNDEQPSALNGDIGSLNRRTMTLAMARQTSSTATAATTNIYNVSSITRAAIGTYDVALTVPVDDLDNVIVNVTPTLAAAPSWLVGASTISTIRVFFNDLSGPGGVDTPFSIEVKGFIPG
jgi:hypothetical protein